MLRLKSFTRCWSKSANVERRKIFPLCAVKVGAATVAPFHGGYGACRCGGVRSGTARLGGYGGVRRGAVWLGMVLLGLAVVFWFGAF